MEEIYEVFRKFLKANGINADFSHTSSGERNIEIVGTELTLQLSVEIYDQNDGSNEIVPLQDVVQLIVNWR